MSEEKMTEAEMWTQVSSELASIRASTEALEKTDSQLAEAIRELRHEVGKLRDGVRIPAATWIAAGSLILLLGSLTLKPLHDKIGEITNRLRDNGLFVVEHVQDGHPERIEDRLDAMDIRWRDRVSEVNRRFIEDVDSRLSRMEVRNAEHIDDLRDFIKATEDDVELIWKQIGGRIP